jgi:hypothetical protein
MKDGGAAVAVPASIGTVSIAARQCLLERAIFPDRFSPPIPVQQFMGPLSQNESHLSPLPFDPGDLHRVVVSGLVPHPGDDGRCGTVLDRDSLRPGDGAASNWGRMIGHGPGKPMGKVGVSGVNGQELQDRTVEIFDVFGLGFITASGVGIFAFCVSLGGSLGFEIGTDFLDGGCRCPDAP